MLLYVITRKPTDIDRLTGGGDSDNTLQIRDFGEYSMNSHLFQIDRAFIVIEQTYKPIDFFITHCIFQ